MGITSAEDEIIRFFVFSRILIFVSKIQKELLLTLNSRFFVNVGSKNNKKSESDEKFEYGPMMPQYHPKYLVSIITEVHLSFEIHHPTFFFSVFLEELLLTLNVTHFPP